MNKLALTWAALKGLVNPFGSVFESLVGYALGKVNGALDALDFERRENVQAVLNVSRKALAVLAAVAWLCPTKWQTAYNATVEAVDGVCLALADLHVTIDELSNVRNKFAIAYVKWRSDDDETCVGADALALAA